MEAITMIAALLMGAGAIVMSVSLFRFRTVFRLLDTFKIKNHQKLRRLFNIHQTLMVFFLIGYLAVLYGIIMKAALFGDLFVGLIFFFGAVFVLLGIHLQSKMLSAAKERYSQELAAGASLQTERSKLIEANKKLLKEMKDRRRIAAALRESEEHLKTIFDSVQAGILIIDPETHTIVDTNSMAIKMAGAQKSEIIGHECHQYVCPAEKGKCPITDLGQRLDKSERFLLNTKGKPIPILKTVIPLVLKGRQHLLETFVDISAIKQAEENRARLEARLRRAQKMEAIGTLAGGVAHDLNNILSGIVSYPDLLLMDLPEESPLRDPLETIQESGLKAAAIVQDLLTLARRGVAISEVMNLNTIIREYLLSPEYEKLISFHPGVRVETALEADLLNILGSTVHLSKTVMNLVSNAAEAIEGGGEVVLRTENRYVDKVLKGYDQIKEGDYVALTVSDNGMGIEPTDLERIFEPFYTKKVMGRSGTGLGMAVVWGTVKDHNGYIDVRSVLGEGSTFTVYFPATREAGEISPESPVLDTEQYRGAGESILVVDDVKQQRDIASSILEKLGYRVKTVSSGEAAVDYMKSGSADLLVLDMIMDPGIDGLETYLQILKLYPGQKAIITSGFSETERVKEAQKLGAGQYVKKPYTFQAIGKAVKTELSRSTDSS